MKIVNISILADTSKHFLYLFNLKIYCIGKNHRYGTIIINRSCNGSSTKKIISNDASNHITISDKIYHAYSITNHYLHTLSIWLQVILSIFPITFELY